MNLKVDGQSHNNNALIASQWAALEGRKKGGFQAHITDKRSAMGVIVTLPVKWTKIFQMELALHTLPLKTSRDFKPHIHNAFDPDPSSLTDVKLQAQRRKICRVSYALPETAASVAIAATVVGAAATLLVRRSRPSEATEIPLKICEDCGGSGICSECNGEGFVLKKLSEASAEKARLTAKNMATRYTAGLPKKWSYCTKCSSARSCSTCGGSGKLSS